MIFWMKTEILLAGEKQRNDCWLVSQKSPSHVANCLDFLCLSVPMCKIAIIINTSEGGFEDNNTQEVLRIVAVTW